MTPRELAAFRAGLAHAADMAMIAALTLEIRDDARQVRQQAAIAALRGLAEGLRASEAGMVASTPCPASVGPLATPASPLHLQTEDMG